MPIAELASYSVASPPLLAQRSPPEEEFVIWDWGCIRVLSVFVFGALITLYSLLVLFLLVDLMVR
jgi:hypothetical protein